MSTKTADGSVGEGEGGLISTAWRSVTARLVTRTRWQVRGRGGQA